MTAAFPVSLAMAHAELGWPSPEEVRAPAGAPAKACADLVRAKIGRALARFADADGVGIGVLMPDSRSDATAPPLAIVVEFRRQVGDDTLRELQRLAWNFSHSQAVITVEPDLIRIWSCCIPPDRPGRLEDVYLAHELARADLDEAARPTLERGTAEAIHWVNLVSGQFFADRPGHFARGGRADEMLLRNLRHIRAALMEAGLRDEHQDVCHDLLARIVFVQFLFDRKDADGNAALTADKLRALHSEGVLRAPHEGFAGVLGDYDDTYALFDWLNARFNGDLFPGKGDTPEARAVGWAAEKSVVTPGHLALLAAFVRGDLDMPKGQGCLWRLYAFDIIPLEFISSIYETFVADGGAGAGVYYTPPGLVDFVLDRALPWECGPVYDVPLFGAASTIAERFMIGAVMHLPEGGGAPAVERAVLASPGQLVDLLPGWEPLTS